MSLNDQRTHSCGELGISHQGEQVVLSGWVDRRRNLGSLIFIDLRDRFGVTQLVLDQHRDKPLHDQGLKLRSEWVISIRGVVRLRTQPNLKLKTGAVEIVVEELKILSTAKTPPFSICETEEIREELRLQYRYLDIRRGVVAKNLVTRHKVMLAIRNYMDSAGFVEIGTPILGKSTPEGSRDYLVPSRIHPGTFYALPQSPQLFKQLLMIAGMDRYFQIATCFRDEDLRSDRQPEFTQVDIEMSFATPSDLMRIAEELMGVMYQKSFSPFPQMTYLDCLEFYGTDKPDLRFGMKLIRIDQIVRHSNKELWNNLLTEGGCAKSLVIEGGASLSRREIDCYTQLMRSFGVTSVIFLKWPKEGLSANISNWLEESLVQPLLSSTQLREGDCLVIGSGKPDRVNQGLDHLRRQIGKANNLIDQDALQFVWVTDFPLFRWNQESQAIESEHHPFTAPHPEDLPRLKNDPLSVRAVAYDLVLNGYELCSGSQRIHESPLQEQIFHILQLTPEEVHKKFGFFVEALQYGTPPHLGLAIGLDRAIMILAKTDNIRDVIAFPKTIQASDLMLQAPSCVSAEQLDTLALSSKSSLP